MSIFAKLEAKLRSRKPRNWLRAPSTSPRAALAVVAGCFFVWLGLAQTTALDALDYHVARRLELTARAAAHRTPPLDPRLKIMVWDDGTTDYLDRLKAMSTTDMPLGTWARLFEGIAQAKPALIFIDRIFRQPMGRADGPAFVQRLKATGVPIIVGGVGVEPGPTTPRMALADLPEQFRDFGARTQRDWPSGWARSPVTYYVGPWSVIAPAFHALGHIAMGDHGFLDAFQRVEHDGAVPYWLYLAPGLPAPLTTSRGRIPVDIGVREDYLARAQSIGAAIQALARGEPIPGLAPGDYVVVLPNFYTGSTDFKDTAVGRIEGGFLHAALLNSALRGEFLRPVEGRFWHVVLALALAAALALRLRPTRFWLAFPLALAAFPAAGVLGFVAAGVQLPWLSPALAFAASGIVLALDRQRSEYLKAKAFEQELEMGRNVQTLLLPQVREGELRGWSWQIAYEPYGPMSGDWMQVHVVDEPGSALVAVIAIGDVVGKGTSAALITASIATLWRRHARSWTGDVVDGDAFAADLDASIHEVFQSQQFTTLSIAFLYQDRVVIGAASAPPWVHLREGGAERVAVRAADPIGSQQSPTRRIMLKEVQVAAGDTLIAMSDGVIDGAQYMAAYRNRLGELRQQGQVSFPVCIAEARRIGAASIQPDDFSMLLIRRTGS